MRDEHGEPGNQVARETFVDRVRSFVEGPEPYTVREIADGIDVSRGSVEEALDALEAEGVLASKTVGEGLEVWYRTDQSAVGHTWGEVALEAEPEDDGGRTDASGRLEAVLSDLEVPGTSEMMREWRRDAVRAVVEYLREEGAADAATIQDEVFPGHAAGYDDPDRWWGMVEPRLDSLPGIEDSSDGEWRLDA